MTGTALKKFVRSTSVNSSGELTVNAGRYSRAAVIMAFEMTGGIETFAQWAEDNPDEFYTKMFAKLIGRETEANSTDDVEDMLSVLDADFEDVTDATVLDDEEIDLANLTEVFEPTALDLRMAREAAYYAEGEPLD